LKGKFELPFMELASITAWRETKGYNRADTDATVLPLTTVEWGQFDRSVSQEFIATSRAEGPVSWIGGVDYHHDYGNYNPYITNGAISVRGGGQKKKTFSGFADLTVALSDALSVLGGVRYTYEETFYKATRANFTSVVGNMDTSVSTPRMSVRYAFTDDTKAYATYSKGFKGGGFNVTGFSDIPFLPEKIDSYEIGLKSRVSDVLRVEAAAFYYDYKDIQFNASVPVGSGGGAGTTRIYNASAATLYGGEIQLTASPMRGLDLNGGLAYTHSEYKDFANALITVPLAEATCTAARTTYPCGNSQLVADASGNALVRSPKLSANLGGSYTQALSVGSLEIASNLYYSSGFYADPGNRVKQKPYAVLNGTVSWLSPGERFKISIWGRNLTDEAYSYAFTDSTAGDVVRWAPPRTFGVGLEANW
jgi:iron complex outermembrane receptor protein